MLNTRCLALCSYDNVIFGNIMPLKVEDNDVPKSAGSVNGKEQVHTKLEYCYEPEMEEV